jgi:hypothetical protein
MDPDPDADSDPDPAIFFSDLQDVNYFFAYYFLKVHLRHFSKQYESVLFLIFLLDERRILISG